MTSTVVETTYGKLEGRESSGVIQWRGIPYAAPPVGQLRFRPPAPPVPWAGVRDATQFGPISIQPASPVEAMFGAMVGPAGEDCLYLNVYAPTAEGSDRPVMVWIHGGAFVGGSGSSPWYDGSTFASHGDVVVVTLNYRLGALGFLHLAEVAGERYPSSGNCGILDQIAALRWVRNNIEAFGGDPSRITVFGESAGGMSVGTMLAMPAAAGLFKRAILQSGSTSAFRTRQQADRVAAAVLAALDVRPDQLADVPATALLEAQMKVAGGSDSGGYSSFQPVVDGISLPNPPGEAIAAGSAADVAVMTGSTHDEATMFVALDPAFAGLDDKELHRRGAALLGEEVFGPLVEGYRAARNGPRAGELLEAIITDMVFRIPAVRLAEAQADHGNPGWVYRFDWTSPAFGGRLKATHALDIPFVWNIVGRPGAELFTGDRPGRLLLADQMHGAWLAFARSGDPSTPLLPDWPRYQPERRATMIFDETCRVEDDPDGAERRLWDGII